jgi:hypothetical protein
MLGAAMTPQLWDALQNQREYDLQAHRDALAALPESWERARPGGPAPPAARAAHAVDAKKRRKAERAARRLSLDPPMRGASRCESRLVGGELRVEVAIEVACGAGRA